MIGRTRRARAMALCGVGLFALAGCADPAADIPADPLFEESARPAESRDYPNLSTVPPRPDTLPSPEDRARIREQLERDRALLREQTAPPAEAP